jgi:PilX N-terminal
MTPRRSVSARHQHGVATLMIVMALFFLVSLVAAYASRNLIFEQRTSANQYRSTQAFEAAEAGIEWALGLLNGSLVDATCMPTADTTFDSFRARYLGLDPTTGSVTPRTWNDAGVARPLAASCVRTDAGWSCSCPSTGLPNPNLPVGEGVFPAFQISFEAGTAPGQLRIASKGCSTASTACLNARRNVTGDASVSMTAAIALAPAMPSSPAAALTVHGNLDLGAFALRVINADPTTRGITIHAGSVAPATLAAAILESSPGTPAGTGTVVEDATLAAWTADRMFMTFFGVDRAMFKRQPTTVVLDCALGCGNALRDAVLANPGRPIWINGDLSIDNDVTIGSAAAPALIVVEGKASCTARPPIG